MIGAQLAYVVGSVVSLVGLGSFGWSIAFWNQHAHCEAAFFIGVAITARMIGKDLMD